MMNKESIKKASTGNTIQSVLPVLLLCFFVMVFGKAYPQYSEPSVTNAAIGGVVACIGALIWRYGKATLSK